MSFIPGLPLCEAFYREAVAPILNSAFPDLRYSAARIGPGSDVLGYDSERSIDHGWGPGVTLFLAAGDRDRLGPRITSELSAHLPATFRGYSTGYDNPSRHATRTLRPAARGRVNHDVQVATLDEFIRAMFGIDPGQDLTAADWLLMPQQALLEVRSAIDAASFAQREAHLCAAYETVARMHNRLAITAQLDASVRHFHERPYLVLDAERFASALIGAMTDPEIKRIHAAAGPIGGIDQFADSTNLLGRSDLRTYLRGLFTAA